MHFSQEYWKWYGGLLNASCRKRHVDRSFSCRYELDHLFKVVSARFLHCKVTFFHSAFDTLFFGTESCSTAHTQVPPHPICFLIIEFLWRKTSKHTNSSEDLCKSRYTNSHPDTQTPVDRYYRQTPRWVHIRKHRHAWAQVPKHPGNQELCHSISLSSRID